MLKLHEGHELNLFIYNSSEQIYPPGLSIRSNKYLDADDVQLQDPDVYKSTQYLSKFVREAPKNLL